MTRSRSSLHGGSLSGSPESGDDSSDSKSEKDDNSPLRGRHVERSDEHVDSMDLKSWYSFTLLYDFFTTLFAFFLC